MDVGYFRKLVILCGATPAIILMWDGVRDQLGANAVNNALHITGILSLIFLFLSLVITPFRVMTGWSWLIAGRRALGLYGFFYAILHFVIYVGWDRMGSVSSTVEEIFARRFLAVGFIALVFMVPLAVTSTQGMIRRLGASRWKLLHRLSYFVVMLGVLHYYMLVKSDVRQPIAFALVLTPILGFRVIKHYVDLRNLVSGQTLSNRDKQMNVSATPSPFFRGELLVSDVRQETPDVKTFRFVNPLGGVIPFQHRAGQYMTLTLELDGVRVRRSYTLASSPSQRGHVELTIKRHPQGLVSRYMHERVRVGQRIQVAAPAGKFWFDGTSNNRILLIAGGVGITPMMSMVRYLSDIGWRGEIFFLNAVRTEQDVIFADELTLLAARNSNLFLVHFFSQSKAEKSLEASSKEPSFSGGNVFVRYGYLNAKAIQECVPVLSEIPIYICGPEAMMLSLRETLAKLGVSPSQIFTEEFVSPHSVSSHPSPQGDGEEESEHPESTQAIVKFTRSGVTIQVESQQTLLDVAEQHRVKIDSECRSGICGHCKVRCLSGRVSMETTEALSHGERGEGWILACQAKAMSSSLEIDA